MSDPVESVAWLELPEVAHARFLQLPAALAGQPHAVGVLATRPHDMAVGLNIHYDSESTNTFQFLGIQEVFSLRAVPTAGWSAEATGPFSVEVVSPRDREILDDDPGPTAARDNRLLMLCVALDETSAIAEDADGLAQVEILSIEAFALTAQNTYAVTALRGRFGTRPRTFDSSSTEVWIIPGFGIKGFGHADFAAPLVSGFFRLQPFASSAQRPLSDCLNRPFSFPSLQTGVPQVRFTHPSTPHLNFSAPPGNVAFAGEVEDDDANLTHVSLFLGTPANPTAETVASIPLAPTGLYAFERVVAFSSPGEFILTARAQDASGNTHDATVTLSITSGGGSSGQVATPAFLPNGAHFWDELVLSISCATAGATINVAFSDFTVEAPPASGWVTYSGPITLSASQRVWAYASASAMEDSPFASADFVKG